MDVIPIHNLDDPRLEPYRDLKDRELAASGDRFICEGEHLVRRVLASDFPVESVLVQASRLDGVSRLIGPDTRVFVVPDGVIDGIIGYKFHLGMLACARRTKSPSVDELVKGLADKKPKAALEESLALACGWTVVVCPQVINHDNMGSLVRTCAALGADALVVGQRSCDPFWRRSVRVSMGSVFSLPIVRSDDIVRDMKALRESHGFQLIATVIDEDALPLHTLDRGRDQRVALVVGNEAQGLPASLVRLCDVKSTIPMHHGTDSLNVTIATAIFLHHLTAGRTQR